MSYSCQQRRDEHEQQTAPPLDARVARPQAREQHSEHTLQHIADEQPAPRVCSGIGSHAENGFNTNATNGTESVKPIVVPTGA